MELIEPWKTLFTDQVRYLDTLVIGHCIKRTQVKCVLQNLATKINMNLSIFAIQTRLKRQKKNYTSFEMPFIWSSACWTRNAGFVTSQKAVEI